MPVEPEATNIQEQIQRYLRVLGERWYFIAVITVITLLIGFSLAQLWPDTYEASTVFVLRESNLISDSTLEKSLKKMKVGTKTKTLAREIRSTSRIMEVMRDLEWNEYIRAQMSRQDEIAFIARVSDALTVEVSDDAVGETQVTFNFEWTDPRKAAAFCNAMRDLWINKKLMLHQQDWRDNLDRATLIVRDRETEYIKAKQELERFDRENNFASLGIPEANYDQLGRITENRMSQQATVNGLEGQINKLKADLVELPPILELPNQEVNPQYKEAYLKLQSLQETYRQKSERLTEANRELQILKEQLVDQEQLVASLESEKYVDKGIENKPNEVYNDKMALLDQLIPQYETALRNQENCKKALDEVNERISKYPPLKNERDALEFNVTHCRTQWEQAKADHSPIKDRVSSFQTVRQKGGNWETKSTFRDQTFEVLSSASAKDEPKNPMTFIILTVSLFVGIGLGLALSLVGELIKSSFSSQEEVLSFLRKPVLGAVNRIMTESEIKAIKWRKVVFASSSLLLIFSLVAIIYICNRYPQLIPPAIVDKVMQIRESLS